MPHAPNIQVLSESDYIDIRDEPAIEGDVRIQNQGPDPIRVVFGGAQPAKGQQTHGYRLVDREYIDIVDEPIVWVGTDLSYQRSSVNVTEIS